MSIYNWIEENASEKDKGKFKGFVQNWSVNFKDAALTKNKSIVHAYFDFSKRALEETTKWESPEVKSRAANALTTLFRRTLHNIRD